MTTLGVALDALPKVELHCHLEGTMRPETLVDLARRNDVPLPTSDPTELYRYDSLDGFLRVFWLVQSTLAGREGWARLAYESVIDGAEHGVVHREAFFTPARHLADGQDLADIVAGLDEGLAAAEAETGADWNAGRLRSAACHLPADRGHGPGVRARAAGFRLTAHQGENSPASAVAVCIDELAVERIDHALQEMVEIALDGVGASWLDDTGKAALRRQITSAATALAPEEGPP